MKTNPVVEMVVHLGALQGAEPSFKTDGAAAMDLHMPECLTLQAGETKKVQTGISLALPDNICGLILSRSGLGSSGLVIAHGLGLLDPDYRGTLILPLYNRSRSSIKLTEGQAVAQLLFLPFVRPTIKKVAEFSTKTARGSGGFGSTG